MAQGINALQLIRGPSSEYASVIQYPSTRRILILFVSARRQVHAAVREARPRRQWDIWPRIGSGSSLQQRTPYRYHCKQIRESVYNI